jgi:hypothetical protein
MDICGVCKKEFSTEQEYLTHVCSTGVTPKDPKSMGPNVDRIQEAAALRGSIRIELEHDGVSQEEAQRLAQEIVAEETKIIA